MWRIIENEHRGFDRADNTTWNAFKSSGKYGLSMRGPCFNPVLVNNRQNEVLGCILRHIVGDDVIIGHDRFSIYRATDIESGEKYKTPPNIHLDINPWWWLESSADIIIGAESLSYESEQDFIKENNLVVRCNGRHVQGVINFEDNLECDGGTLIVPCFHKYMEKWCADNESRLRRPIPWVTLNAQDNSNFLGVAQRVPMRKGSVLMWDQTMMHGSAPNSSKRCRMGQFFKAGSRSLTITESRLRRRSKALLAALEVSGAANILTENGLKIFGLSDYMLESNSDQTDPSNCHSNQQLLS